MTLSKPVYELLCMYEGPNPREAFKPHLMPADWRDREARQLIFRSQVPDGYDDAYDVALNSGYFAQHILEPNEQVEWYRNFSKSEPAQRWAKVRAERSETRPGEHWPIVPNWFEAIVRMTEKGRAALAEHRAAAGDKRSSKATGTPKMSLDAQAVAVFLEHPDWTKKQIAGHLGKNEKSLAPKRCPRLAAAIKARKAPDLPRGAKDSDGNLEAWEG